MISGSMESTAPAESTPQSTVKSELSYWMPTVRVYISGLVAETSGQK